MKFKFELGQILIIRRNATRSCLHKRRGSRVRVFSTRTRLDETNEFSSMNKDGFDYTVQTEGSLGSSTISVHEGELAEINVIKAHAYRNRNDGELKWNDASRCCCMNLTLWQRVPELDMEKEITQ